MARWILAAGLLGTLITAPCAAAEWFFRGTANGWAAYASRIQAVGELQKAGITSTSTLPLENVNAEIPQELQELEQEAFLQIISGEKPVDYFDTFVVEWYANGGKELTEQIQNAYESGKD